MNWDWYQATFTQGPDEVLPVLQDAYGIANSVHQVPGRHSYRYGVQVRDRNHVMATAYWGGINGNGVHVQATGSFAPPAVQALRRYFPQHRVSRADVKEDYTGEGMWEQISGICLEVAKEHGVKVQHVGDFTRGEDGRSLYFGAKTSQVRTITYEKGKQLGADPNWVRVEVRARPKSSSKELLAWLEPPQVFGCSTWTLNLSERLGVPDVSRHRIADPWRPSDEERALKWLLRQYGPLLAMHAGQLGGWCQLGVFLGEKLAAMKEEDECVRKIARGLH